MNFSTHGISYCARVGGLSRRLLRRRRASCLSSRRGGGEAYQRSNVDRRPNPHTKQRVRGHMCTPRPGHGPAQVNKASKRHGSQGVSRRVPLRSGVSPSVLGPRRKEGSRGHKRSLAPAATKTRRRATKQKQRTNRSLERSDRVQARSPTATASSQAHRMMRCPD